MVRGIKKRDIEYILVLCSHLKEELESITSQMEEYFDERSEAWQDGDGGSVYQEKMMDVEFITGYIEEAQDTLSGWYEE